METIRLIPVRALKKIPVCAKMSRFFVDYLRQLGEVSGTKVKLKRREVWKYTPDEAALIQSVWYFRTQGFELKKSIELAKKHQANRREKRKEANLFSDIAP